MRTVTEVRLGRNYVRADDTVRVKPSAPHKQDGFDGRVQEIVVRDNGTPYYFRLAQLGDHAKYRAIRAERVQRRQQTRNGERAR